MVICADNQAALLTLAANNQEGLEYGWGRLNTVRWRNSFLLSNQPSNCV